MTSGRKARLVIASAIVVVSFAAILIRLCSLPTALVAAWRLTFASLILLPVFLAKGKRSGIRGRDVGLCILAGLFLALHFLFWIESLRLTTVASSVVLVTTSPVFAAIFAWVVLKEGISRRTGLAIVLCLAGSTAIGRGDIRLEGTMLKGDLFAVGGAAMFGAFFVAGRSLRHRLGFLEYAFTSYLSASILLVVWATVRGHSMVGFAPANYLWLFLLGLGPQVYGHTSLVWALRYIPAPKVAISILGEPVGSSLLAWLVFHEVPAYTLFVGAALILYGVYLAMTEGGRPSG